MITAPVAANGWNEALTGPEGAGWWSAFIAARLNRAMPLPTTVDERTHLINQVTRELFGNVASAEEIAAFVADVEPSALDSLAKRLARRAGITAFSGSLTSGPTKFRVLAADPDAATKPRVASNPGRYTLGENIRFIVSRRPDGERIVNEARIQFFSADPTKPAPGEPREIKLPDGYDTWAAAWIRDATVLWVLENGAVRAFDFADPAKVKETVYGLPTDADKIPKTIFESLRSALNAPGGPKPVTGGPKK